jgi:hypothetical protein
MGIATFPQRELRAMTTLQRLCNDANVRAEADPESPADPLQMELFNAQLDHFKKRHSDDSFICAIPKVYAGVTNQRMFIRARNLRAAVLTAPAEIPDAG